MISFFAKLGKKVFLTLFTPMKSWCLLNFRVQIALDCILEYLNFQNFAGGACPPNTPSFSCFQHSSLTLSCQYYTYSQLCPTKEKTRHHSIVKYWLTKQDLLYQFIRWDPCCYSLDFYLTILCWTHKVTGTFKKQVLTSTGLTSH